MEQLSLRRNVRISFITGLLLLLIFLVIQSNREVYSSSNSVSVANEGFSVEDGQNSNTVVQSEIDEIKEKIGLGTHDRIPVKPLVPPVPPVPPAPPRRQHHDQDSFDPVKEYSMILDLSPVVILSRQPDQHISDLKRLLETKYLFTPNFYVIELDKHLHGHELQKYITRITGADKFPHMLVGGKSRGDSDYIMKLDSQDKLLDAFTSWSDGSFTIEKIEQPSNN